MLTFYTVEKAGAYVNGPKSEREEFCKKMELLGMKVKRRNGYDIIAQKNIRSISKNHITIHQDNGARLTWGKSEPIRVLEAMQDHRRNGYVRYLVGSIAYHRTVKRGKIDSPTKVWETYYPDERWFPLAPRIPGWIQIVQNAY